MKCLILAAGYGTRMQSVTGDVPKALIRLGEQTILDRLLTKLEEIDVDCTLVTNQRYHQQFQDWRRERDVAISILNNGTSRAEERLGAVGDIAFALETAQLRDDLLIVGADNLFHFSLTGLCDAFRSSSRGQVAVRHNPDREDQKRRGVVEVDAAGRITGFTEKPAQPASELAAAPLYVLPRALLGEVASFLAGGGNPDAPGYLIEHLVARHPLQAWRVPAEIVDVGNPQSYEAAQDWHRQQPET